jgi:CBS domain-containing protein
MLVDAILQTKGSAVYTLPDTATLADAIAMLNAHNIGAIVVASSDGVISGILSERDIVRQLGKDATSVLATGVSAIMTRGVVTCQRDTPLDDVMERMTSRRIRHIPVTEDDRLIGIISIGDVVKRKIEEAEHEAAVLKEYIAS